MKEDFQINGLKRTVTHLRGWISMLKEFREEIIEAIGEAFGVMEKKFYIDFILFIGRADIIPGLKKCIGSDCVIDYHLDNYFDETRTDFYLHYLNRNYTKDGFTYSGESGFDDLNVELMIYSHIWDSSYFVKSLLRIASIVTGKGYVWNADIPWKQKAKFMNDDIIGPLKASNLKLGELIAFCYDPSIRNAFAHSLYTIDLEGRKISVRPEKGPKTITFEKFQTLFLKSVLLANIMENALEANHNAAAQCNISTEPFFTPDGLKVQVMAKMEQRGNKMFPEFRLERIID